MAHISYSMEIFSGTTAFNSTRINRIVNSVVPYVYGIRKFMHISEYVKRFL